MNFENCNLRILKITCRACGWNLNFKNRFSEFRLSYWTILYQYRILTPGWRLILGTDNIQIFYDFSQIFNFFHPLTQTSERDEIFFLYIYPKWTFFSYKKFLGTFVPEKILETFIKKYSKKSNFLKNFYQGHPQIIFFFKKKLVGFSGHL
jgi:hypothetical protein